MEGGCYVRFSVKTEPIQKYAGIRTINVDHSRIFHPGLCYFTDYDPVSCDRDTQSCEAAEIGSAASFACSEGTKSRDKKRGEPKSLRPA